MSEEMIYGPLLTDEEFFTLLDGRIKGINSAKEAFFRGERDEAVHLFAEFARANIDEEKYFSMRDKPIEKNDLLITRAERALNHEMVSCGTPFKFDGPVDWFANPTFNNYGEWTWQLSRHPEIQSLAFAYKVTGDERYADGAVELLLSWIRQATRPEDGATRGETLCWRTIEAGIRMLSAWPDIIHSLIHSPAFTDRVILDVFKSVYEHGHRLISCLSFGNWLIMELCGVINISVLYPYFTECDEWREIALNRFIHEMSTQVHPDGFQYELTTNYQDVVLVNMKIVMLLTETYGYGIKQELHDTMRKMLHVYVKLMQSGWYTPDINDGSHQPAYFFIRKYIRFFPDDEVLRYIATEGKEGHQPEYTSSVLKNAGMVTFRESWDEDAVTAFFDAGKLGKAHIHQDKLNLLVYADGKPIITEAGCYAYDRSEMRRYSTSAFGHNVCIINDMGQSRPAVWNEDSLTSEEPVELVVCKNTERSEGIYNESWGGKDFGNASHKRSVIFVKKPAEGRAYFIVIDDVCAEEESERAFLWHLDTKDLTLGDTVADSSEIKMLFLDGVDRIKVDEGAEDPLRGWIANSAKQGDYRPVPTLNVIACGKNTRTVTLIAPKHSGHTAVKSAALTGSSVTVTYESGRTESFDI